MQGSCNEDSCRGVGLCRRVMWGGQSCLGHSCAGQCVGDKEMRDSQAGDNCVWDRVQWEEAEQGPSQKGGWRSQTGSSGALRVGSWGHPSVPKGQSWLCWGTQPPPGYDQGAVQGFVTTTSAPPRFIGQRMESQERPSLWHQATQTPPASIAWDPKPRGVMEGC